jgi:hypothetical protein
MNGEETQSAEKTIDPSLKYNQAQNRKDQRVRGLWERNDVFYAQIKVRGWTSQVPLHNAKTVRNAQEAGQALKAEIKAGNKAYRGFSEKIRFKSPR